MGKQLFYLTLPFLLGAGIAACSGSVSSPVSDLDKSRETEVTESMRRLQISAENYAADHGGNKYPVDIDDAFKCYLPGGDEHSTPAPIGVVNIFSGENEFPELGKVKDLHTARFGGRISIKPGKIEYCPLDNGKGYAILGGGADGKAIMDEKNPGEVLVYSNYEE